MAIYRTVKDKAHPYLIINKEVLNTQTLSARAKGLHCYLMSKPDDWTFYANVIGNDFTDGRASVASGLKELVDAGYIIKKKSRNKGRFDGWEYHVYEVLPKAENHTSVSPKAEILKSEKPKSVDQQPLCIDSNKVITKQSINIYIGILEYWNSKNIIVHKKLSPAIKRQINTARKQYTDIEIKAGIDNYAEILKSSAYYFSYSWRLDLFLKRGLANFIDRDIAIKNYSNNRAGHSNIDEAKKAIEKYGANNGTDPIF